MTKNRETKPKQSGGFRPGAGRKFKGVPTEKIRLNKDMRDKLRSHVDWLVETGGKFISQQEYSSNVILKYTSACSQDESLLNEIAENVAPSYSPWATLTITQEAYNQLSELVKKIEPLTPVYTNLSNVFTVIILKEIRKQKKVVSAPRSNLES
ncbi:MAG: hypothetical protein RMY36_030765 [Nostoc sp. SerVER01]|nr:hypothetical protein [Nostoc sp. SerVER01]